MRKWLNISARDSEYGADTDNESENDDVREENDDFSSDEEGLSSFFSSLLPNTGPCFPVNLTVKPVYNRLWRINFTRKRIESL